MNNLPVVFDSEKMGQLSKACEYFSKSALVPHSLRGKPQDIMLVMVMAHELGVPPMQALTQIAVIQGKPTVSPQLMIGLVRSKLPKAIIKWDIDSEKKMVVCTVARNKEDYDNGFTFESMWDMTRAATMGLSGKDNYVKQPLNMLKWRATGEAIRTMFPDVVLGIYLDAEFKNFDGSENLSQISESELLEQDFPRKPEDMVPGPDYLIFKGKFKGKKLRDIDEFELDDYIETMDKGKVKGKYSTADWIETYDKIKDYFDNYKTYQEIEVENRGGDESV